jgi:hypothetical protein
MGFDCYKVPDGDVYPDSGWLERLSAGSWQGRSVCLDDPDQSRDR